MLLPFDKHQFGCVLCGKFFIFCIQISSKLVIKRLHEDDSVNFFSLLEGTAVSSSNFYILNYDVCMCHAYLFVKFVAVKCIYLRTLMIRNASRYWLLKASWHIINKKLSKNIRFHQTSSANFPSTRSILKGKV